MIRIDTFKSLSECFAYINDTSDHSSKVLINEYSTFDELQQFREEILYYLLDELKDEKNMYLIVASGGYGGTARIRAHYKLWKSLEKNFDISDMCLSEEETMICEGNVKYAGIARFDKSQIKTVIDILYNNPYNSFAIITDTEVCIEKHNLRCLFDFFFANGCLNSRHGRFNYSCLLSCLEDGDVALKMEFDGEELALFSINKLGI